MSIDIDRKNEGNYGTKVDYSKPRLENGNYQSTQKYVSKKETYEGSDLFERVVHSLISDTGEGTYATFKSKKFRITFQNFNFVDTHNLRRVDIYFPKSGQTDTPLVIVITTNRAYCYQFSQIKGLKGRREIKNFNHFNENKLLDKLIAENNTQNNVITYRLDKTTSDDGSYDGITVVRENHPSFEKYKHTPVNELYDYTATYLLYSGKSLKLTGQSNYSGNHKLTSFGDKRYSEVFVFYTRRSKQPSATNLPKYLELTEHGNNTKRYFERTSNTETEWKQINDPELDSFITYFLDKKTEAPTKYNDNSINIIKLEHKSFDAYTHTPEPSYADRKSRLWFNDQDLQIEQNEKLEENVKRLVKFEDIICVNVTVFYFNERNQNDPIFLELKLKSEGGEVVNQDDCTSTSNCYLFKRADLLGVKWRQVNYLNLRKTITYYLDCKDTEKSSYNNNSVKIGIGVHRSFGVYIHRPVDEQNFGLLLYNFEFLVLNQNKGLPGSVQTLDKLEGQKYNEIKVCFFRLSNKSIEDVPTYIELSLKENPTKYYLERDGQSSVYWKQIEDPNLKDIVTYFLDKKGNTTYNGKSVTVKTETHSSFNVYTHEPVTGHINSKGYLLFNDNFLILEKNKHLSPGSKALNELNGQTYTNLTIFYYKEDKQTLPVFLELKLKETQNEGQDRQGCDKNFNCYLLKRSDEVGTRWKQIDYVDLKETITYQLEWKDDKKKYNGDSVTVTRGYEGSFEIYTHTSTEGHEQKLGLLIYEWKMLTLQSNENKEITNKLDKLQGTKYSSVITYYPKESTSDKPPLYLKLTTKSGSGDGTNLYYLLQRTDENGTQWKQITEIKLSDVVTYYLDKRENGRNYNGISVKKDQNVGSFEKYIHKPTSETTNKNGLLLYNGSSIVLEKSTDGTIVDKLTSLYDKKYSEVCVFFVQSNNDPSPVFIELKENSGSKTYWLQKVSQNCLLWKEINDPQLSDAIAYRLEFKNTGSYNGNHSIRVAKNALISYNKYTHSPQNDHTQKKSYILQNGNLITLEIINEIGENKLNQIQNRTYTTVTTFYKRVTGEELPEPPFFLELTDNSNTSTKYCLLRIDKEGLKWTQIGIKSDDLTNDLNRKEIFDLIDYYTKKSVMIFANLDNEYQLNLIDNSTNQVTDPFPSESNKKITVEEQKCDNFSGYKFYKQDISHIRISKSDITEMSNALGFRLFLGSIDESFVKFDQLIEIKLFDSSFKNREYILFNPFDQFKKEVYVYFHPSNNVPLMICHSKTYFKPRSFVDYFNKWSLISELRLIQPCDSSKRTIIIRELNSISTSLNRINIQNTDENGYGLFDSSEMIRPKGFDGKLIDVNKEIQKAKFLKITHTPINGLTISKIKFGKDQLQSDNRNLSFSNIKTVSVHYYKSDSDYKYPLLLLLDGGANNRTYYQRKSTDSNVNWKKISDFAGSQDDDSITDRINKIRYEIGTSIVLKFDEKSGSTYQINLVKNYTTSDSGTESSNSGNITVNKDNSCLPTGSVYTCLKHSIALGETIKAVEIGGLKLTFCGIDIEICNEGEESGKLQVYFDPEIKDVYVYFYGTGTTIDTVPLLAMYNNKFYRPKSLENYFNWLQVSVITTSAGTENVKKKLEEINKEFNKIKLETTSKGCYGKIGQTDRGDALDSKARIKVTTQPPADQSFTRVQHTTTNTGPIGKITHSGKDLMVLEQGDSREPKLMSTEIKNDSYNTVYAYYHTSDSSKQKPLLLGFSKGASGNPDMFFERVDNTTESKWKRVSYTDDSGSLGSESALTTKINGINYTIKKSIMIQMEKQTISGYDLMLVRNSTGSPEQEKHLGDAKINVSEHSKECELTDNYKCYKHSISPDTINSSDIAALRFYINKHEVTFSNSLANLGKLVIYIHNIIQVCIYVYFHNGSTVPLLLKCNDKYYGPISRDKYFDSWEEKIGITKLPDNLQEKLDDIHKDLNRVDLDEIATFWDITQPVATGPANTCRKKYGIPYPGKDPPDPGLDKKFYERICVTACVSDKYRKQVHATINKYQIGGVYFHNQKVTGINYIKPEHNQVEVYYDVNDHHFSRPLLIKLTSQDGQKEPSSADKTWYRRKNLEGTDWEQENGDTGTYESDDGGSALKEELESIAPDLYTILGIELNQKQGYEKQITVKTYHTHKAEIKVEKNCSTTTAPNVTDYQCCEQKLCEYYNNIKRTIGLQGQQPPEDPTLVLEPEIAGIKLGIFTTDDKVSPVLTYGKGDANTHKRNLAVYFWKGDGGIGVSTHGESGDPVPLMFICKDKFYGPLSKEKYFWNWRELGISSPVRGSGTTDLKQKLDQIHEMLNGIDLTQTKSYGLKCCSTHQYYFKNDGFNSKRVSVTKYRNTNKSYTMYLHNTVHKNKIGKIRHSNNTYKFDQHSVKLGGKKIDQVGVIYKASGADNTTETPVLVLLNQDSQDSGLGDSNSGDPITQSTTYGYYYHDPEVRGDTPISYKFYPINAGCKMMAKLMGQGAGDGSDCQDHITDIKSTWEEITSQKMNKDTGSSDTDVDTKECKGPILNGLKEGICEPGKGEDSTDGDLIQVQEAGLPDGGGQDDRPKVGSGDGGHERGGPGGLNAGTIDLHRSPGPAGARGNDGARGSDRQPATSETHTEASTPSPLSPDLGQTTIGNGRVNEERQHTLGGVVHGGGNGGGGRPGKPRSSSGSEPLKTDSGSSNGDIWKQIVDLYEKQPEIFYGSGGGAAGVGIMDTVVGVLLF